MHYLPIDVNTTEPQSGGSVYPEGFYILQIEDATQQKATKDGKNTQQWYKTRILMGPGWSQEFAGKVYNDRIMNTPDWAGRHMELACAAIGSKEGVRQLAAQHGGHLPAELLNGRNYIAQLNINGSFNNVIQRLPYSQEAWNEAVDGSTAPAQQLVTPSAAPVAPPMAAPPMAPPQQFAPPAQQFAPPAQQFAPPAQQFAPPAPMAPPQQFAPPMAPPAPPPPPGMPASR